MRIPRDLAKRIDLIERAIRLRLPPKPTPEQIRYEIQVELAEEKFNELVLRWESEFEPVLNGSDVRALNEAVDELIDRIQREPIMQVGAWGPRSEDKSPEPQDLITHMAQIYIITVENVRDEEIQRINMESRDSDDWKPMRVR